MSRNTIYVLVVLNLIGILLSWLLPSVILAVHNAHAYSTYIEFTSRDLIDISAVEEWRKRPGEKDYQIQRCMQEIGGLRYHLPKMSWILTALFATNVAVAVWAGAAKKVKPTTFSGFER